MRESREMKILVINCGSSTIKFQVISAAGNGGDLGEQGKLARGLIDRIGGKATCDFSALNGASLREQGAIHNHEEGVGRIIDWLQAGSDAINSEARPLEAVGHRVVHGGDEFTSAVRLDDAIVAKIDALSALAPLHNPPAVNGIRAARKILGPAMPMVAAFDTSFHHTVPKEAATYAIPRDLSKRYRIRRYGFHGLAHQYSMLRYGELSGTPPERIKVITMHLGNGCSATAVSNGRSVDTSMGFTPLEGLVMGTRSGDVDPALVSYLAREEKVDATEVESWLNKRSGLLGLSGLTNDMRELIATMDENPDSRLAVEIFCYRARKYLGAYLSVLGGAQAVIFSGGIGENAPFVRQTICVGMEWCGLWLDDSLNGSIGARDGAISTPESKLKAYVIHTDEEAIIAHETAALLGGNQPQKNPNSTVV
jgi:acetate kinase